MAGIFNKVAERVNKGVATVGANSKAMVEKARIKTVISNLETERKQLAELLGMKIYEEYLKREELVFDEGMKNFIAEIKKRLEMISQQKEKLQRIEEEVKLVAGVKISTMETENFCACGYAITLGAKFCAKCGSSLQE